MTVQVDVRLKRGRDGDVVLTCMRADGSTTWQRQTGANARFFPMHDLTHLAVESVLGIDEGFFGLVARGWEISDFGSPWPRGPLPPIAADLEMVVGFLDSERLSGEELRAAALHERSALQHAAQRSVPPEGAPSQVVTDAQLRAMRELRAALFALWQAVAPGDALTVCFPFAPPSSAPVSRS